MFIRTLSLGLFVAVALVGCDGGGNLPPERPGGDVSGTAFDGLVINADVTVYSFADGEKGADLANGVTDGFGEYAIDLQAPDQPILIEVTLGQYEEEASRTIVQLEKGDALRAVQLYTSGEPITMSVTYFTTLATGLAEYWVQHEGLTAVDSVALANQRISTLVGVDIENTLPLNVADPANRRSSLTPELRYGFLTASISQWTANASTTNELPTHEPWNSISFTQLAYDDIRNDGVLDGRAAGGQLSVGTIDLNSEVYRYQLALAALEFTVSARNETTLGVAELRPAIELFNEANDPIYGNTPVGPIDFNGTVIADFVPAENATVFATFNASATLANEVGLASVDVLIDGLSVNPAIADLTAPNVAIDSTAYADGEHTLSIVATTTLGAAHTFKRTIKILNSAPAISNIVPVEGARLSGTVAFSALAEHELGVASVQFFIDNAPISGALAPAGAQVSLNTVALTDANHTFTVEAVGANGAVQSVSSLIATNNSPPTFSAVAPPAGSALRGVVNVSAIPNDLFGIANSEILLDGNLLTAAAVATRPATTIDTSVFNDGPHSVTFRATGNITQLTGSVTSNVVFDNTGPALTVIPAVTVTILYSCPFTFRVSDPRGVANVAMAGQTPTANGDGTYTVNVQPEQCRHAITATDSLGNSSSQFFGFDIDSGSDIFERVCRVSGLPEQLPPCP